MIGQAHGEITGVVARAKEKVKKMQDWEEGDEEEGQGTGKVDNNGLYTGFQETYGTIGPCTWGYCESPNQWGETKFDPRYGEVVVRHGFADTQWMREHSKTWAKDEQYFMMKNGMSAAPLTLQDENATKIT